MAFLPSVLSLPLSLITLTSLRILISYSGEINSKFFSLWNWSHTSPEEAAQNWCHGLLGESYQCGTNMSWSTRKGHINFCSIVPKNHENLPDCRKQLGSVSKPKQSYPMKPTIPHSAVYPRELIPCTHTKQTDTWMPTAALITAEIWQHHKYPSKNKHTCPYN